MLLDARDEYGAAMTADELRDEMLTGARTARDDGAHACLDLANRRS
jgi:hypothetical protein